MRHDWVRRLLVAALCVLLAGTAFSMACQVIWPSRWPSWVARTSSAAWFAGVLLAGSAGLVWARHR